MIAARVMIVVILSLARDFVRNVCASQHISLEHDVSSASRHLGNG